MVTACSKSSVLFTPAAMAASAMPACNDAEEDGGDDNDVAVRGLQDEAQTMQH